MLWPRQDRQAFYIVWGWYILEEYILFWVVSSSLIAVCADAFWVGDIKTLLVKVLIHLVPGGSQADLFKVS